METASRLEALCQGHLMAAITVLGQMPRGVGLCVDPYRFRLDCSGPDTGWNPEGHRACRYLCPRGHDRACPDERG